MRRVLLLILIVAAFAGCAGNQSAPERDSISLNDALAQIDALPTPDGANAGDFAQLKTALAASLQASGKTKFASAIPPGNMSEVTDLSAAAGNPGEVNLHWTYKNRGDYDQNSEANVADLTPLGVNLFKTTASPDWDSKAVAADGDGNGEVNVSDITPLGSNLFGRVDGYVIESTTDLTNEASWAQVDTVDFADGGFESGIPLWKFTVSLPAPGTLTHYRVKAFNGTDFGPPSNVASYDPGEPPVANSVAPTTGDSGTDVQFTVDTSGGGVPTSFAWDFGGGATPNTSSDEMPTVTMGAAGTYSASVTVSNSAGSDSVNFTLTVNAVSSVQITDVQPTEGTAGAQVTFTPTYTGSPDTFQWVFGGAATPDVSLQESPAVQLKTPGTYTVSLTATDSVSGDSDTFSYSFTVNGDTTPPAIDDVNPKTGDSATDVQFAATLSGTPPDMYAWDFGGGATPNTSADPSPTVTLGAIGTYSASLTVSNANGSDTFNFNLEVVDPLAKPDIWEFTPTNGGAGDMVTLTLTMNPNAGVATSWLWNFDADGDGASLRDDGGLTSTEESPTFKLAGPGAYAISVIATNEFGSDAYGAGGPGDYKFFFVFPGP